MNCSMNVAWSNPRSKLNAAWADKHVTRLGECLIAACLIVLEGGPECLKQGRIAERLEQALRCTLFEQSRANRPICAGGDKDDRNLLPATLQFPLKVGSTHPRHRDIENQALSLANAIGGEELFGG